MNFDDLLRIYNVPTKEQQTPRKQLHKLQIQINESYLSSIDELSKKQGVEKKVRELNSICSQEMMKESSMITNDKRELLDLIDDLLDMISNPHIKLSKEQLINKLKGYREQLKSFE